MITTIPKSDIILSGNIINNTRRTRAEILAEIAAITQADTGNIALFNSAFFTGGWGAASGLVHNGSDYYVPEVCGYALGTNPVYSWMNNVKAQDWIGGYPTLIHNGEKAYASYDAALGGRRQRTAMGLTAAGDVVLVVSERMTLDDLTTKLLALGCVNAINLDGGGSSQGSVFGAEIRSSDSPERIVYAYSFIVTRADEPSEYITAVSTSTQQVYDASGLAERNRYISGGDVCRISRMIDANMLVRVSYPTGTGTRAAYVKTLENFRKVEG